MPPCSAAAEILHAFTLKVSWTQRRVQCLLCAVAGPHWISPSPKWSWYHRKKKFVGLFEAMFFVVCQLTVFLLPEHPSLAISIISPAK